MMKHVFETDCQCTPCHGTGIYQGFAEKDGAAVVCHKCKGTGKAHIKIEYDDFEGRKVADNVRRVFKVNPGIGIGENGDGTLKLEDFGGIPYEVWAKTGTFPRGSEMRQFVCPAWWAQSAGEASPRADHTSGGWCKSRCGGMFSGCVLFDQKADCWAKYDAQLNEAVS